MAPAWPSSGTARWATNRGPGAGRRSRRLYVANYASSDITVLDADSLQPLQRILPGSGGGWQLGLAAADPAIGRIFVVSHSRNQLLVLDGANGQILANAATDGQGAWGLAVNTNLHRVYVSNRDSSTVVTLDSSDGYRTIASQQIKPCGDRGAPYSLAFNPANERLYVACAPDSDVDHATILHATAGGLSPVAWLALPPGGSGGGGGVAIDLAHQERVR